LRVPPPAAPPQAANAMLVIMSTDITDRIRFDISPPREKTA
jgi:hypothetical protein